MIQGKGILNENKLKQVAESKGIDIETEKGNIKYKCLYGISKQNSTTLVQLNVEQGKAI